MTATIVPFPLHRMAGFVDYLAAVLAFDGMDALSIYLRSEQNKLLRRGFSSAVVVAEIATLAGKTHARVSMWRSQVGRDGAR